MMIETNSVKFLKYLLRGIAVVQCEMTATGVGGPTLRG